MKRGMALTSLAWAMMLLARKNGGKLVKDTAKGGYGDKVFLGESITKREA